MSMDDNYAFGQMQRRAADEAPALRRRIAELETQNAKLIGERANCTVEPAQLAGVTSSKGNDTIYMTVIDKDGNIVSLIQSNYSAFGSGIVAPGTGFVLHNRGGLFTLERNQPNTIAPRKRPLHTIIPAFMEKLMDAPVPSRNHAYTCPSLFWNTKSGMPSPFTSAAEATEYPK